MTTLPTTTPVRLPRPAGPQPLGMPMPVAAQPANAFQMTGADVWRVIRSNIWLILIMFVLSIGIGFALNVYLARFHSSYTATGLAQVSPPVNPGAIFKGT